jgi:hypothetical protein
MVSHLDASFSAVPDDVDGNPLLSTYDKFTYDLYLKWLADYLYRPKRNGVRLPDLSRDEAWSQISAIESAIAFWIWDHPGEDYPPDLRETDPQHADFPHRVELCHVLSRVPSDEQRVFLLDCFFQELARDAAK